MTLFDFSNIADLGKFWDGSGDKAGGGQFNAYVNPNGFFGANKGIGMNNTNVNSNLDLLYQNLIGRNADPGGRDYWRDQIQSGATTYQGVADAIKASGEYSGQQSHLTANPNATGADLKALDSAYVSPFHTGSGSAAGTWRPGDALTQGVADAVTTAGGNNYGDQTNHTVGGIKSAYDTHNAAELAAGGTNFKGTGGITGGVQDAGSNFISADDLTNAYNLGGAGGGGMSNDQYNTLLGNFNTLTGTLNSLKDAFSTYKDDMQNMWDNANWGSGNQYNNWGQTVSGVKTQNELPGWKPKTGGSSGFFGRGGNRFGLSTSSLNI